MALSSVLTVQALSTLTSALDLVTGSAPLNYGKAFTWPSGTAASQADRIFSDTRTIAASGTDDLDLAGVLTDAFGATCTFVRVRGLIVFANAANTNNVIVGNAAANGFITWVGAAAHTVTVRPGGLLALIAPDTTGYAVTAGTGDILRVANSGAGTSVTYDIVIIGASA